MFAPDNTPSEWESYPLRCSILTNKASSMQIKNKYEMSSTCISAYMHRV